MDLMSKLHSIADYFQADMPSLTREKAIELALQFQRNKQLEEAFCLQSTTGAPGALEKIAMGIDNDRDSIKSTLKESGDNLDSRLADVIDGIQEISNSIQNSVEK